jgi:hypothetical protein
MDLGGESKRKEPRRVHAYIPQQIVERKASKSLRENTKKRLRNSPQKKTRKNSNKP